MKDKMPGPTVVTGCMESVSIYRDPEFMDIVHFIDTEPPYECLRAYILSRVDKKIVQTITDLNTGETSEREEDDESHSYRVRLDWCSNGETLVRTAALSYPNYIRGASNSLEKTRRVHFGTWHFPEVKEHYSKYTVLGESEKPKETFPEGYGEGLGSPQIIAHDPPG